MTVHVWTRKLAFLMKQPVLLTPTTQGRELSRQEPQPQARWVGRCLWLCGRKPWRGEWLHTEKEMCGAACDRALSAGPGRAQWAAGQVWRGLWKCHHGARAGAVVGQPRGRVLGVGTGGARNQPVCRTLHSPRLPTGLGRPSHRLWES